MAIIIGEKRILRSALEPPNTNWLWLKTTDGSPALYEYLSGKWVPFFGNGSSDLPDKYVTGISVNGGAVQYPVSGIVSLTIEGGGGYSPPTGVIPKKDLSSDVQGSLSKADTALQSQQQSDWDEGDDSVPNYIRNKPVFATVATSGSYNDLSNKPTIPAAQVQADWNATSGMGVILNKPTIPTVPSWAQQPTKPTYTAQEVGALPASTFIPTKVSDLTNDAGYTSNTGTVTGISVNGETAQLPTNGVVNLTIGTGGPNDIVGISDGTAADGAVVFTKRNGDTITLNLNHLHQQYLKYELLADEAAYTALSTKDSSTLYLIPAEEE